ncbi:hypothetical protein TRFO_07921 [Tritrichomonas foetus]|uniref:Uncharacterized protein n=1 Tax=Tritrichomonas foetus TaxID=1144522 RepID=A0A1J4JNC8_9EUKA|nr:hypothetical protein TRFO_07921 [Tritrichomonas foetus]|eukprot:OHT00579.1 hypothetical protein TRFO_07921 [Tritrichomonas foetus]
MNIQNNFVIKCSRILSFHNFMLFLLTLFQIWTVIEEGYHGRENIENETILIKLSSSTHAFLFSTDSFESIIIDNNTIPVSSFNSELGILIEGKESALIQTCHYISSNVSIWLIPKTLCDENSFYLFGEAQMKTKIELKHLFDSANSTFCGFVPAFNYFSNTKVNFGVKESNFPIISYLFSDNFSQYDIFSTGYSEKIIINRPFFIHYSIGNNHEQTDNTNIDLLLEREMFGPYLEVEGLGCVNDIIKVCNPDGCKKHENWVNDIEYKCNEDLLNLFQYFWIGLIIALALIIIVIIVFCICGCCACCFTVCAINRDKENRIKNDKGNLNQDNLNDQEIENNFNNYYYDPNANNYSDYPPTGYYVQPPQLIIPEPSYHPVELNNNIHYP